MVKSGPNIDVEWDLAKVRTALSEVSGNRSLPDDALAKTAFHIFSRSGDDETRLLCLATLYRLNTVDARKNLSRVAKDESLDPKWRALSAAYLNGSGLPELAETGDGNGDLQFPDGAND